METFRSKTKDSMKHWLRFLVGAYGAFRHMASEIESKRAHLEDARRKVRIYEMELEEMEEKAFNTVSKEWTIEEITEAKQKAKV